MIGTKTLASLYDEYGDSPLLERLEQYAIWTIPSVFPDAGMRRNKGNALIEHDYQSVGALYVNRLATKLARTLFPVGTSFFRIDLTNEARQVIKQLMGSEETDDIALVDLENKACRRLLLKASYAQLVQALKLLIITGECLLHRVDGGTRVYSLRNYVLQRNHTGDVQRIIIKECKKYFELTPEVKTLVGEHAEDSELELYTQVLRKQVTVSGTTRTVWEVTQEIAGKPLDVKITYRDKLCPYIPVTWSYVNGDAYGRGYVEEYAGDFAKLSELSEQLTIYELQSAKVLNVYDPQGTFDIDSAVDAQSGDWITGKDGSVRAYEVGDYRKIQELRNDLGTLEQRLSVAFMYTGNTREGERVTAYEIQMNAQEAEQVLGGVYSQLSQAMHYPLAYLLLDEVDPLVINAFDAQNIEMNILTGLIALSRSSESQALIIAANQLATVIPVFAQLGKQWDLGVIADNIILSNGVDPKAFKKSKETLLAEAQQEEQAAIAQQQAIIQQGNQLQNTEAIAMAQGQQV